ncbi:MAG: 5'-nucleotidase C-terminal domain-containing protein [Candidatus Sericytochromatia bacterium]|nr:5'-nucleotidase C-terminal domain-containing protein [Candidatus Sericytochromatia bacterium]
MSPPRRPRLAPWLAAAVAALAWLAPPGLGVSPAAAQPEAAGLHVQVLGTTDVHGRIYPTSYYGDNGDAPVGVARLQTLIKRLRAEHPISLLVDSGDCLQGTALTYHNARIAPKAPNPMVQAYNHMGFDAFAVGNHEYNYDLPYLLKARQEARYPFVSGNIYHHGTERPVFEPYVIKEVGGVRIGILGFTTPGVAVWDRRFVQGKHDFGDIVKACGRWLPEVRKQGVDAVIVVIHSGLGDPYDATFGGYSRDEGLPEENVCARLAETYPGLDAILLGHSHKDLPKLLHHGVLLTQAKKWGERLAVVDLHFVRQGSRWRLAHKDSRTLTTEGVPPDPEVLSVARQAHEATVRYVNSVIGRSTDVWSSERARIEDTPIMDLVNEVQLAKTGAQLSSASVFNAGASLPKGELRVKDIAALYVYENTLTSVRLTGSQLRAYLEHSARCYAPYRPGGPLFDERQAAYNHDFVQGVDYTIDVRQAPGHRITALTYRGKPVADDATFTMALNSYRQNGGGGYTMLKQAPLKEAINVEIRELMLEWVRERRTVDPRQVFRRNWRLVPEDAIAPDGLHYR